MLAAFTYKGKDSVEMDRRRKRIEELRANNRRKRDANMIRSVYTRDGHAEAYDPALIDAIVATEMKFGDTIPSGTYLDMAVNLPLVDPTKVKSPVLMLRGEHDGPIDVAEQVGAILAERLLTQGGKEILEGLRIGG